MVLTVSALIRLYNLLIQLAFFTAACALFYHYPTHMHEEIKKSVLSVCQLVSAVKNFEIWI